MINVRGQLTRYTEGSVHELWTISYPLILSMLSMNVMIFLPSDRLDVHTIASSCGKIDDTANPTATWETKPLDLAGIPNWAAALLINDKGVVVFGTYRGVFIRSCGDVDRKNDVAKLFNDEAAKLEAA